ncbi:MAG: hypothetical protein JSV13_05435 [Nitrospiraceae bacterium]|nr:MAG: hypothetical protein JSV13_05435 [Nitrospiraceae bacterium]
MKNYILSVVLSGVILFFLPIVSPLTLFGLIVEKLHPSFGGMRAVPAVYAGNTGNKRSPYGHSKGSTYGEKQTVRTAEEAEDILQNYFTGKEVTIGKIREKKLYFEADILDKDNKKVDSVIIDKRTGRIRSIY